MKMFGVLLALVSVALGVVCEADGRGGGSLSRDEIVFLLNASDGTFAVFGNGATSVAAAPLPDLCLSDALGGPLSAKFRLVSSFCDPRSSALHVVRRASVLASEVAVEEVWVSYARHAVVSRSASVSLEGPNVVFIRGFDLLRLRLPLRPGDSMWAGHVHQWGDYERMDPAMQLIEAQVRPGAVPFRTLFGSYGSGSRQPVSVSWMALASNSQLGDSVSLRHMAGYRTVLRHVVFGLLYNGKSEGVLQVDAPPTGNGFGDVRVYSDYETNHTLSAQSPFEWPGAFFGCFDGDIDDAANVTHAWTEAFLSPPAPDDNYPWVQFDSWSYGQDIDEENMLACAKIAERLGVEAFVLDLGWAAQIGEWVPNPNKFPRGLGVLSRFNFRLGLHLPVAQVNMKAPIVQSNPSWPAFVANDYFGATALCLGNDPARSWLVKSVVSVLTAANASYIVQDGEDMIKLCRRADHSHNIGDSNYANSVGGLDLVWAGIRNALPDIVLENCEDGGTMMTFQVLKQFTTSISVDDSDAFRTRQGAYHATFAFPPRYTARYLQDAPPTRYTFRSSIFGGPLILQLRLTDFNASELAFIESQVAEFKRYRRRIATGMVIHHSAPLGSADSNPAGYGFDAIQSLSHDRRHSLSFIYRSGLGSEDVVLHRPRRLIPTARYRVRLVDANYTVTVSGKDVMDGINVKLSAPLSSEIIEIDAV